MNIDEQRAAEHGLPWGGVVPRPADYVCFPLKSEMPLPVAVAAGFPAPLVASVEPLPAGVVQPGPVFDLGLYGTANGWTVASTYSRGWVPHAKLGTPIGPKNVWAVRMIRGDRRAVAVRTDDTWTSYWTWSPRRLMRRSAGLIAFKVDLLEDF